VYKEPVGKYYWGIILNEKSLNKIKELISKKEFERFLLLN
jgi:hypothetical protein